MSVTIPNWVTFLKSQSDLTTTDLRTSIFPSDQVPQSRNPPYLLLTLIGDEPVRHHGGHAGLDLQVVQFDLVARNKGQAREIWDVLRRLDTYVGEIVSGKETHSTQLDLPQDTTEPPAEGEQYAPARFTAQMRSIQPTTVTAWT
tara:strand:+ start:2065 stop:2496 length:432 start_codon:yes stop_codon:yes gene_type:complete